MTSFHAGPAYGAWTALLAACAAYTASSTAAQEVSAFGVTKYGAVGECCSNCDDLTYSLLDANDFAATLDSEAGYDDINIWWNKQVDGYDWCNGTGGDCGDELSPYGTDFADVVFYSGHGAHVCNHATSRYYSYITMGDSQWGDACLPQTGYGTPLENIVFGDTGGDANIVVFAACQTAQFCVHDYHGYGRILNGRTNTLAGFHGDSYDSLDSLDGYRYYAELSEWDGIGDNWLALLEQDPLFGSDQCPVVVVEGETSAANNSQYANGGFQAFHDTGSHLVSSIYYECECDPSRGPALPGC